MNSKACFGGGGEGQQYYPICSYARIIQHVRIYRILIVFSMAWTDNTFVDKKQVFLEQWYLIRNRFQGQICRIQQVGASWVENKLHSAFWNVSMNRQWFKIMITENLRVVCLFGRWISTPGNYGHYQYHGRFGIFWHCDVQLLVAGTWTETKKMYLGGFFLKLADDDV